MKGGRIAVLIAVAFVALLGFGIFVIVTAPLASTPDLSASSLTPDSSSAPSPSPSPAPADPCHRNGMTYCALNPAVTQATINSTICVTGWTATIRPPESYTEPLKLQQISAEGLAGGPGNYEEDHRMPLELGGDPRDTTNLSPESHAMSYTKDAAENAARREVCAGAGLRTVQAAFVATWLGPYPAYVR